MQPSASQMAHWVYSDRTVSTSQLLRPLPRHVLLPFVPLPSTMSETNCSHRAMPVACPPPPIATNYFLRSNRMWQKCHEQGWLYVVVGRWLLRTTMSRHGPDKVSTCPTNFLRVIALPVLDSLQKHITRSSQPHVHLFWPRKCTITIAWPSGDRKPFFYGGHRILLSLCLCPMHATLPCSHVLTFLQDTPFLRFFGLWLCTFPSPS